MADSSPLARRWTVVAHPCLPGAQPLGCASGCDGGPAQAHVVGGPAAVGAAQPGAACRSIAASSSSCRSAGAASRSQRPNIRNQSPAPSPSASGVGRGEVLHRLRPRTRRAARSRARSTGVGKHHGCATRGSPRSSHARSAASTRCATLPAPPISATNRPPGRSAARTCRSTASWSCGGDPVQGGVGEDRVDRRGHGERARVGQAERDARGARGAPARSSRRRRPGPRRAHRPRRCAR